MKNFFMIVCAFFLKKLARMNRSYENLKEPKRFLIAMSVGMGPFILLNMLSIITENILFDLFGLMWIFLIIGIRVWWLHGDLKDWLP